MELNQTCNYKCPHCIIGNPDEMPKMYDKSENLSFDQYKKIVDEIDNIATSKSSHNRNENYLNFTISIDKILANADTEIQVDNFGTILKTYDDRLITSFNDQNERLWLAIIDRKILDDPSNSDIQITDENAIFAPLAPLTGTSFIIRIPIDFN